ncbi:MAG: 4-phosphoerythronate dehydrogenase PdxB [Bacteroidales bacterium]|nr:4-phosphoerythronate dehydrogenase PdxB [Bacteroidales bacterium]
MKIVADNKIPFLEGVFEGVARVEYLPGGEISRSHLLDADGLITRTRTKCNRDLLEGTSIRFIASATIGYDHIDTDYCREKGIGWTNAPGCNSSSVEQYIVSTLLWLAVHRNLDLSGTTLGVVGVGNVGSKVAAAASALGMKVLLNDPPRERREGSAAFVSLKAVLEQSDIISLHVPLNKGGSDNTYHLVNREFLSHVKRGVILINSSRGSVVDEPALLEGIGSGMLSDVILDVYENEPAINRDLLDAITLATPHIAGYSLDGKANGTAMSVRAMSRFFGLGLNQWSPASVPAPNDTELLTDGSESDLYPLLWELFRQTYDVTSDMHRLRNAPGSFEKLRGDYPFRREPAAYAVRLFRGYPEIRAILEKLGFKINRIDSNHKTN